MSPSNINAEVALGIDASKDGWVGVILDGGSPAKVRFAPTLPELIVGIEGLKSIGIDIPLRFVERGTRECDGAARRFVGPRSSSVFSVPPLAALDENSHAKASARAIELGGTGITTQAFALKKRIIECRDARREINVPMVEVHPEVCFCAMNAKAPLRSSKKSWDGIHARIDLLAKHGISIPDRINLKAGVDDVLDAAAAAWTASRVMRGESEVLPSPATQRTPQITY